MSRTYRVEKLTLRKGGRDCQSCAPCLMCGTGRRAKRHRLKRERRALKTLMLRDIEQY